MVDHLTILNKIIYYITEECYCIEFKDLKYNTTWEIECNDTSVINMYNGGWYNTEIKVSRN